MLLVAMAVFTGNVHAQYYFHSVVPGTTAERTDYESYYNFPSYKLNETTLLIYSVKDQSPGIYAFNVTKNTLTKIIDAERADRIEFLHFTAGSENEVMIDMLGQLYVSNGTRAGTRYLGDFGFKDVGNVTTTLVSNVIFKQYVNGAFYFHERNYFSDDATKVWRSFGTAETTKEIGFDTPVSVTSFMPSPEAQGLLVYGYSEPVGYGFWSLDAKTNTASLLGNFDKGDRRRDLRVRSAQVISKGLVFCRSDYDNEGGAQSLWRLSRSGKLLRLAEKCKQQPMYKQGELLYFFSDRNANQLWSTDGTPENTRLAIDFSIGNSPRVQVGIPTQCRLGDKLYVNLNNESSPFHNSTNEVWVADLKNISVERLTSGGDNLSLGVCLENFLVMAKDNGPNKLRDTLIYRIEDKEFAKVYGITPDGLSFFTSGINQTTNRAAWQFGDDVLLHNVWSDITSDPEKSGTRIVKLTFKNQTYLGYLPPILSFLAD